MSTRAAIVLAWVLALSGCGTVVERDGPGSRTVPQDIPDAVPKDEPRSKYGNPESYVVFGKRYYTLKSARGFTQKGIASWYGKKFHGRKTSSGEVYDMYEMTAAHKQLPLPTYVEVRNLDNDRRAIVKVNDRGPFHENRVIDLSYAAANKLGIIDKGTGFVEIRVVDASGAAAPRPTSPGAQGRDAPERGVYLQVGAFQQRSNAEALRDRIAGATGSAVYIREINSAGRTLFRVQLGPIASVETADAIVSALELLGITQHYFVTD